MASSAQFPFNGKHFLKRRIEPTLIQLKKKAVEKVLTVEGADPFWESFRRMQDGGTGPFWETTDHDVFSQSFTPLPIRGGACFEGTTSRSVKENQDDKEEQDDKEHVEIHVGVTAVELALTPPKEPEALADLVQVTTEQVAYHRERLPEHRIVEICPGVFASVSPDNKVILTTLEKMPF